MMNRSGEPCDRARLHHHPSLSWYPIKPDHALAKDHGLASVDQHALFGHPAHRAREYLRLGIAADADQFVDAVAVIDALDRLFDDRPLVEIARPDRKSVVLGQCVSVRVDLGGRRLIKKKKKKENKVK